MRANMWKGWDAFGSAEVVKLNLRAKVVAMDSDGDSGARSSRDKSSEVGTVCTAAWASPVVCTQYSTSVRIDHQPTFSHQSKLSKLQAMAKVDEWMDKSR